MFYFWTVSSKHMKSIIQDLAQGFEWLDELGFRLLTLKFCSVFLNRIYEVSTMCPNCVGSARQWCKNEQSFLGGKKKCHIWLMPYATNFDGCCLINPAVMRQSCPSIRQKSEQKSSEERKNLPANFSDLFRRKKTWYWWAWNRTRRKVCVCGLKM